VSLWLNKHFTPRKGRPFIPFSPHNCGGNSLIGARLSSIAEPLPNRPLARQPRSSGTSTPEELAGMQSYRMGFFHFLLPRSRHAPMATR